MSIEYFPKIKICGLTNLADAQLAVQLGVNVLGFNFYPKSSRFVRYEKVKKIIYDLISSIGHEHRCEHFAGVAVNPKLDDVKQMLDIGITAIQLHGEETIGFVDEIRSVTSRVSSDIYLIKALRLGSASISSMTETVKLWTNCVDVLLFDSLDPILWGGSGRMIDKEVLEIIKDPLRFSYLAGGLTPENVKQVTSRFNPLGVDVASGVELRPGIKDAGMLRAFVHNART